MELQRQIGLGGAIIIVIASMFGTGIFITTGIVLEMTRSSMVILVLWCIGGLTALMGSLCYAELASIWPDAGGEYVYLKQIFGLLPSFLTGWISLVVGFSASVATAAITLVEYLNQFLLSLSPVGNEAFNIQGTWMQKTIAASIIVLIGAVHIHGVRKGSIIQNFLTSLKLIIVVTFIGIGFYFLDWQFSERLVTEYTPDSLKGEPGIPVTGLALLIIMFSYSGWNGAVYMAGEIKNPGKNLPRALFIGTSITILLYIALNVVFMVSSPPSELMGQEAVGAISARNLFGENFSLFFTLGIVLILLSSISVQVMTGPRVYYAMARDRMIFQVLGRISPRFQSPAVSISIQIFLAVIYVYIGTARTLMEYMGFALGIFPVITVIGLIYLRIKNKRLKREFSVPFYPVLPIFFIGISVAMLISGFLAWTNTSKFALGVVAAGIPVYFIWRRILLKQRQDS